MSDDTQRVLTADLKLVLRNTEKSARDAQAALEAIERLVAGVGPRFDALEARLTGLEGRLTGLERRLAAVEASVDVVARNTHRAIDRRLQLPDRADADRHLGAAAVSAKFVRVTDFETTGLDPANADVIEAGWCDVYSPDYRIDGPYSALVQTERPIEIEARAAHHIAPEDLKDGVPQSWWREYLACNEPVAFVAHNSRFEASFWPDAPAPWICTYKSALRLFPEAPRFTNPVLRYWLDLDADPGFNRALAMPPHRAGPDAYVTAHIFVRMLRLERNLARMFQWTLEPEMPPRVMFGKHFGAPGTEVPEDYLAWILRQTDFDEGRRWAATQELARREAERQPEIVPTAA